MKNVAEWRRRGLIGLIVVAMAVGLYFGFRPRPVLVEIGTVSRGPLRVALEQEGGTRVIDRYVVSAPVAGYARRIGLEVRDGRTAVVWNPGETAAARMPDVGPHWREFVCLEAANAGPDVVELAPGATHVLVQEIEVAPLD